MTSKNHVNVNNRTPTTRNRGKAHKRTLDSRAYQYHKPLDKSVCNSDWRYAPLNPQGFNAPYESCEERTVNRVVTRHHEFSWSVVVAGYVMRIRNHPAFAFRSIHDRL
jgi:hypothetical protein